MAWNVHQSHVQPQKNWTRLVWEFISHSVTTLFCLNQASGICLNPGERGRNKGRNSGHKKGALMGPLAAQCVFVCVRAQSWSCCGHYSVKHTWRTSVPLLQPNDPARGVEGRRSGERETKRCGAESRIQRRQNEGCKMCQEKGMMRPHKCVLQSRK